MNNYIILDGYRYKTTHKTWRPEYLVPSTARVLLSGALDSTFGNASLVTFTGEIVAPVTSFGEGWGTIETLRASLEERKQLELTDHYGTVYSVHSQGPTSERSLMPDWGNPGNTIYVNVKLMGVKCVP